MAYLMNYNYKIHDLYLYDREPIINWQSKQFVWANPIAYNPDLYIKNIEQYVPGASLPEMDFSGVVARIRGITMYGVINSESSTDSDYFTYDRYYFGGALQTNVAPYAGAAPLGNFLLLEKLTQDGWDGKYWNVVNDYNHWNTGDVPACLISPMHVLIGGHMFDPLMNPNNINPLFSENFGTVTTPTIRLKFIGKNNEVYTKVAKLKFFLNDADLTNNYCLNAGAAGGEYAVSFCQDHVSNLNHRFSAVPPPQEVGGIPSPPPDTGRDLAILEFVVDDGNFNTPDYFRPKELEQIKIYKLANTNTWPPGSPLFQITPNGGVLVYKKGVGNALNTTANSYYNPMIYNEIPARAVCTLDGAGNKTDAPSPPMVWYGDSCNFVYGYYPPTNETVFMVSHSDQGFNLRAPTGNSVCCTWTTLFWSNYRDYNSLFIKKLTDWIYQRTLQYTGVGYKISWVDYSDATEAIIIDNQPYPLIQNIQANTTQVTATGSTGLKQDFAITAYNLKTESDPCGPITIAP